MVARQPRHKYSIHVHALKRYLQLCRPFYSCADRYICADRYSGSDLREPRRETLIINTYVSRKKNIMKFVQK